MKKLGIMTALLVALVAPTMARAEHLATVLTGYEETPPAGRSTRA